MVNYYWDFETMPELKKLDPVLRQDLAEALRDKLGIPISAHVAGFDNPYIEIESDDPVHNHPLFRDGMIPRAGFIKRISVRHLTHQSEEFIKKMHKIAEDVLKLGK